MILPFPNGSGDGSKTPNSSSDFEHKYKLASICFVDFSILKELNSD